MRWLSKMFERRCAVWSLPGVVKGKKPRREREIEISVVSKIVAPRMKTGTSQAAFWLSPAKRPQLQRQRGHQEAKKHRAAVSHENFGGLEIPAQKSGGGAQNRGGHGADQQLPAFQSEDGEEQRSDGGDARAQAVHVIENAEGRRDADDPDERQRGVRPDWRPCPGQIAEKTCARIPEAIRITAAAGIAPKSLI